MIRDGEMVERVMALGTYYAVLPDIPRLIAELRGLRAPVQAAERLRFEDADRLATLQREGHEGGS